MSEMIRLEQVCLRFKTGFALDGLSFQVESGQVFGFLGPSGAGKTTTIKLLTKQLVKDSGQIYLFGKPVEEVSRDDFEKIGVLTDTNGLYERMSIEENLKFFARLRGVSPERGTELLKRMGLYDSRKTPVKKCSKGMRQRVSLAVVLLHSPKLLFLDEPTSGLDPATIQEVHRLLLEMKDEGTTIFLTTHNMEEADKLCDCVGILDQGKLVTSGSPLELKLRYAHDQINIRTRSGEMITVNKDTAGAEKILEIARAGQLMTVHSQEPNLEEIFLMLTGRKF